MTIEYDLIAIGGSSAAVHTALAAARLHARVALVEPNETHLNWLSSGALYTQALARVGRVAKQVCEAPLLGIDVCRTDSTTQQQVPSLRVAEAMQWAQAVADTCSQQTSSAVLASLGVDVIIGTGEFCRRPHLGFVVNNRRLRGRAYLIATGSVPTIPDIPGLQTIGYLTPTDLWQPDVARRLQGNWAIVGGGAIGIELAQTLARLNCNVTLLESHSHILPQEDPEASRLVQAQLEAEGICVLTASPVTQVREIEDKKWVQAGDRAVEADEIMLAVGQEPNLASLNLEGVGVKFCPQGLELNKKLQTTNPRIYACGYGTGSLRQAHIARYEASIALKNALFAPIFKVEASASLSFNYRTIPQVIFCDPQLARVGLTEVQARQHYGKDVFVVRQYFKTLDKAQLWGETTGFCKIIGRQNGEILGASIVGFEASELIGAIALAIRHKLKVNQIANLPQISPTLSEIITNTAMEWQQQRFSHNQTLQNFLEGFFNLRRRW